MGNQAAQNKQHQNAMKQNWTNPSNLQGSAVTSQMQYQPQPVYYETPQFPPTAAQPERQNYFSQIIPQKVPKLERLHTPKHASQIQLPGKQATMVAHSHIQGSRTPEPIKVSTVGAQQLSHSQINSEILPDLRIAFRSEAGKSGSILNRIPRQVNNTFRFDGVTEKIDDIRTSLRISGNKMILTLTPALEGDIQEMDRAIETERSVNFRDKNRVVFILKQKKHYHKICLQFKQFNDRIKSTLLYLRKKDSLQQLTQQEFIAANQLKQAVETAIGNIQKDIPHKGWKQIINKPTSKYYLSVVTSGLQDPEIMKRYNQLELSLSNPQVLTQIANQEILNSNYRKIKTEETTAETAKKLIEGPAHYTNTMRGTKYPVK